ncbi:hypothetical protein Tco_0979143 [Tanacetum coccineum]
MVSEPLVIEKLGGWPRTYSLRVLSIDAFRAYIIEEELTWVKTFGKEVEEYVTKVICLRDGSVTAWEDDSLISLRKKKE